MLASYNRRVDCRISDGQPGQVQSSEATRPCILLRSRLCAVKCETGMMHMLRRNSITEARDGFRGSGAEAPSFLVTGFGL